MEGHTGSCGRKGVKRSQRQRTTNIRNEEDSILDSRLTGKHVKGTPDMGPPCDRIKARSSGANRGQIVRVTSNRVSHRLHGDFPQSPAASTFQLLQSWGCLLSDSTLQRDRRGIFSSTVASLCSISCVLEGSHRRRAVRSQVATVACTVGNGLGRSALIGHRLEMELLLQRKPLFLHFFELCPQGQNMPLQSLEVLVFPHVVHGKHSAQV